MSDEGKIASYCDTFVDAAEGFITPRRRRSGQRWRSRLANAPAPIFSLMFPEMMYLNKSVISNLLLLLLVQIFNNIKIIYVNSHSSSVATFNASGSSGCPSISRAVWRLRELLKWEPCRNWESNGWPVHELYLTDTIFIYTRILPVSSVVPAGFAEERNKKIERKTCTFEMSDCRCLHSKNYNKYSTKVILGNKQTIWTCNRKENK